jgi:hypothetical protein
MPRATHKENIHVEVTAKSPLWGCPKESAQLSDCENMIEQINRHVDGVGDVRVAWDEVAYCSACGSKWTEDSATYNVGCCEDDEKNNPNPEQSP